MKLTGKVIVDSLNIRQEPSTNHLPIGALFKNDIIEVLYHIQDWYMIQSGQIIGFVADKYLDIIPVKARVAAPPIYLYQDPSYNSLPIAQLSHNTPINIIKNHNHWSYITDGVNSGYLENNYLEYGHWSELNDLVTENQENSKDVTPNFHTNFDLSPAPNEIIEVKDSFTWKMKKMANLWNEQGGFISDICDLYSLDPACVIAIIAVESSGNSFGKDGRMIIRFENHIFWEEWGKEHSDIYNLYFSFNQEEPWKRHEYREDTKKPWCSYHGIQDKEWKVFNFASHLNKEAAMKSISMGAAQIMGFNYNKIGYSSVEDMFNNFSLDILYHLKGLFDFIAAKEDQGTMLQSLRENDFIKFARIYNGGGQAEKYGEWIRQHFESFNLIK